MFLTSVTSLLRFRRVTCTSRRQGDADGSADTGIAVVVLAGVSPISHAGASCGGTCAIWCKSDDFSY